jgi:hypothetical protein
MALICAGGTAVTGDHDPPHGPGTMPPPHAGH